MSLAASNARGKSTSRVLIPKARVCVADARLVFDGARAIFPPRGLALHDPDNVEPLSPQ